MLSISLNEQGKYDEAPQAFNKVIEINPEDAEAWDAKGQALRLMGRTADTDAAPLPGTRS